MYSYSYSVLVSAYRIMNYVINGTFSNDELSFASRFTTSTSQASRYHNPGKCSEDEHSQLSTPRRSPGNRRRKSNGVCYMRGESEQDDYYKYYSKLSVAQKKIKRRRKETINIDQFFVLISGVAVRNIQIIVTPRLKYP